MQVANIAFWTYMSAVFASLCFFYPIHYLVARKNLDLVFLGQEHIDAVVRVFGLLIWITCCEMSIFLALLYIVKNTTCSYTAAFATMEPVLTMLADMLFREWSIFYLLLCIIIISGCLFILNANLEDEEENERQLRRLERL